MVVDKKTREEWRELAHIGMHSSLGEYTPVDEFVALLDSIDELEAQLTSNRDVTMISDEFTEELQAAIEVALDGTGVRPSWVMKKIIPVIEKYTVTHQTRR